jgi:hypothetical protein
MRAQSCDIACIDKVNRIAKSKVLNPFVVRESEAVNQSRLFNVSLESGPTCEAVLACDRKLRIAETEMRSKYLLVSCAAEFWMKFSKPLRAAEFFDRVLL